MKFIFTVLFLITQFVLFSQSFYEDGSMILESIETNPNYGYKNDRKNSIKVGEISNQRAYLDALKGPNGETVYYTRVSSCCQFKTKKAVFGLGFLDQYKVSYKGLEQPIILYLNGYDYETPKAPNGFTFLTKEQVHIPEIYPKDKIKQVEKCNDTTYAVVNGLLKNKGVEYPEPEKYASFSLNPKALQNHFDSIPLKDERTYEYNFRSSILVFVNCKGEAGNFELLHNSSGLTKTFHNLVLAQVNELSSNWIPAEVRGQKVDSYQVINFVIKGGKFESVELQTKKSDEINSLKDPKR